VKHVLFFFFFFISFVFSLLPGSSFAGETTPTLAAGSAAVAEEVAP
jgi:hypothetical protein